jgi:hypothetical protein
MTLTELLVELKSVTGRLDLSDTEWTTLVNRGLVLLDQLENSGKTSRQYISLASNNYAAVLPFGCRWVDKVNALVGTAVTEILEDSLHNVRTSVSVSNPGTPSTYTIVSTMLGNDPLGTEVDGLLDPLALTYDPTVIQSAIIVSPKASVSTVIEIFGVFHSLALSATVVQNNWSVRFPQLIIEAVQYLLAKNLYALDVSSSMLKDLTANVTAISYDVYSEANISQMGG